MRIAFVLVLSGLATSVNAQKTLFFDFGSNTSPTPGNYNNIITDNPPTRSVTNAIDSTGQVTNIDVRAVDFAGFRVQNDSGADPNGTTMPTGDAAIFHPEATRGSSYNYLGRPGPAAVYIEDLNPNSLYHLTLFASRFGGGEGVSYETRYNVTGHDAVLLEPANNVSNVATVSNIRPYLASDGSQSTWTISVFLEPGPNNNNNRFEHWHLLGAMRLIEIVPEPSVFAQVIVLLGCIVVTKSTRCRLHP
jgi:hypothetical protein